MHQDSFTFLFDFLMVVNAIAFKQLS